MTTPEILAKIGEAQKVANKAMGEHAIACQAFEVACKRRNWSQAAVEQELALASLERNMDALQAIYRLQEGIES